MLQKEIKYLTFKVPNLLFFYADGVGTEIGQKIGHFCGRHNFINLNIKPCKVMFTEVCLEPSQTSIMEHFC